MNGSPTIFFFGRVEAEEVAQQSFSNQATHPVSV